MFAINYWFILLLARIFILSWADWALKVNQNRVTDLARLCIGTDHTFLIHTNGRKNRVDCLFQFPNPESIHRFGSIVSGIDYMVCFFGAVFWCMVFFLFILMGVKNRVVCHGFGGNSAWVQE